MVFMPYNMRKCVPLQSVIVATILHCVGCAHDGAPHSEPPGGGTALPLVGVHSTTPTDEETRGRSLFYEAVDGDRAALAEASKVWSRLHAADVSNACALAYHGACQALAARTALWPWEKARLVRDGLAALDRAVAASAADAAELEVRFLRGMTLYRMPPMVDRSKEAPADLAYVAERAEQAVHDGRLSPRIAAAALYHFGEICDRSGDVAAATDAWERAVGIAPDSPPGRAARDRRLAVGKRG